MLRQLAVLVALAGLGIALALPLPACDGLPGKTCYGDQVNALVEDAGKAVADPCTVCTQSNCCREVGECLDAPPCADQMKATQRCVIERGPSEESQCKGDLTSPQSNAVYACTRAHCGEACKIPHCTLDPAVILFGSPACDRCISGRCCEEINACYTSRQCKLILECITKHCPRTLGPSMQNVALAAAVQPELAAQVISEVCSNSPSAPSASPGACLQRCLQEFAPRSGTNDDRAAQCLAFKVFTCGARADCGKSCSDLPTDQTDPSYLEDRLDAGRD